MEEPSPGEVHVWLRRPETLAAAAQAEALALLSPEEQARYGRLRFARHRCEYLAAHVLLRQSLSHVASEWGVAAVAPAAWQFETEEQGRPFLCGPAEAPPLTFSLSHTQGLVAVAVAVLREVTVGIDVEARARDLRPLEIAERFFAREEADELRALSGPARRQRFLELWTLKEACAKARGDGLVEVLSQTRFDLDPDPDPEVAPDRSPEVVPEGNLKGHGSDGRQDGGSLGAPAREPTGQTGPLDVRARFAAELGEDASRWQFALRRAGPGHQLAVAVRRSAGPELRLQLYPGPDPHPAVSGTC